MSKHTPRPLFAVQYANWFNIQTTEEYSSSNVLDLEDCEEAEAYANLFAAAPELLEELKRNRSFNIGMLSEAKKEGRTDLVANLYTRKLQELVDGAEAAITKAEGTSESICVWKIEDEDGLSYFSDCGHAFSVAIDEEPFKHCPECGLLVATESEGE